MFSRANRKEAFTLLEVMVAVAIVAMVTITIFRFVEANLTAIRFSKELAERDQRLEGFFAVIQSELLALPPGRSGVITGQPHKFDAYWSDEMSWVCRPGNGLFTVHGLGDYKVTLKLQKAKQGDAWQLGFARSPEQAASPTESWVPLIEDVQELRIGYFNSRLNAWLDKWTDLNARPSLVRVELLLKNDRDRHLRIFHLAKEGRS